MYKKLFIPGPTNVNPDVLAQMAKPMIGHRTTEASDLQASINHQLQTLLNTKNTIILSTSSGTGLMEASIKCFTARRAAVFSVGSFGDLWYEIAVNSNIPVDYFHGAEGRAIEPEMVDQVLATGKYDVVCLTHSETSTGILNPIDQIGAVIKKYKDVIYLVDAVSSLAGSEIKVDAWGIDFLLASTQKCLGLPAGYSLATMSAKAYNHAQKVEGRGYYFDLVRLYDKVESSCQYISTPSISHMFALNYKLEQILTVEGLENRYNRHLDGAKLVRAWAEKHFEVFAAPDCRSFSVTCIKNTLNIDFEALNTALAARGMMISNGFGQYKNKTFRIAHMGETTLEDLLELLTAINDILGFTETILPEDII